MNGTVLHIAQGSGIILGEDGERYTFTQEDVRSPDLIHGTKVNYIAEEACARDIYAIAGGNPVDAIAQGAASVTGGSEVKTAAYIAGFGALVSLVGSASLFFVFVGFAIELYGVYRLSRFKNRPDIFWYQLKAVASLFAAMTLGSFGLVGGIMAFVGELESLGTGAAVMVAFAVAAAVYSVYAMFRSLDAIAQAYRAQLFTVAAWLYLAGMATLAAGIGFVILLAYTVVLIVAYFTLQDERTI